jgi:hypothetical protein
MDWVGTWAEAARTATGFFWKAGWAFVLGDTVSGMIQASVPRTRLARQVGDAGLQSISLATVFGEISSSCSFEALATSRSLVLEGAHFVAAVAVMFASTNLIIELGVLIFIFLAWQYVAAEVVGGLILITISSILIRLRRCPEEVPEVSQASATSWLSRGKRVNRSHPEEGAGGFTAGSIPPPPGVALWRYSGGAVLWRCLCKCRSFRRRRSRACSFEADGSSATTPSRTGEVFSLLPAKSPDTSKSALRCDALHRHGRPRLAN